MACVPVASDEVAKLVTPPAPTATVATAVAPSLNVTVPVGVAPVTVAVNVTDCPTLLGFCDETSAVLVAPGACTLIEAVAALPAPPSLEVTAPVVLVFAPPLV